MLPFFISDEMGFSDEELLLFAAASGKAVEATATGNPLTFVTDLARPLKSLLIPFTPVQSGTGDPSPQNIRSILPWDGLSVFSGGKNLLDSDPSKATYYNTEYSDGYYWNTATDTRESVQIYLIGYKGSTKIGNIRTAEYVYVGRKAMTFQITEAYAEMDKLRITYNGKVKNFSVECSLNLPLGSYVFSFDLVGVDSSTVGGFGFGNFQIEVGSSSSPVPSYEAPHITETEIPFASPVYGGTLDVVSGVLGNGWNDKTVAEIRFDKKADHIFQGYFSDRKYGVGVFSIISDTYKTITAVASTGSTIESLYSQYGDGIYINSGSGTFYICDSNYTDVDAFQTAMANVQVVYELATPQEITLTPQQITALLGNNTIWSDADGSMTAVYLKKG